MKSSLKVAALIAAALLAGCAERERGDDTAAARGNGESNRSSAAGTATSPGSTTSPGDGTGRGRAAASADPPTSEASRAGAAGESSARGTASDNAAASRAAAPGGDAAGAGRELALADRNFVTTAASDAMFEVEAAKVAADRASDPAVKAFADMLVEHHTQVNEELKQIASSRNLPLPSELPAEKREALSKLQQASGAAFDKRFVQQVGIEDHLTDVRSFEKASRSAKDPEVKAWAAKTLPVLRDHLAKARMLPGGGEKDKTTSLAAPSDAGSATSGGIASGASAASSSASVATPPAPNLGR